MKCHIMGPLSWLKLLKLSRYCLGWALNLQEKRWSFKIFQFLTLMTRVNRRERVETVAGWITPMHMTKAPMMLLSGGLILYILFPEMKIPMETTMSMAGMPNASEKHESSPKHFTFSRSSGVRKVEMSEPALIEK